MSDAVRGAGLGLLTLVLVVLLREAGFRGARLVSLVGTVSLVFSAVLGAGNIISSLELEKYLGGEAEELVGIVAKIVGVGIAFGITADACRDMGEQGIAGAVLMLGRVEIFVLATPYLVELLRLAGGYLGL